jgi:hypothetical protein
MVNEGNKRQKKKKKKEEKGETRILWKKRWKWMESIKREPNPLRIEANRKRPRMGGFGTENDREKWRETQLTLRVTTTGLGLLSATLIHSFAAMES